MATIQPLDPLPVHRPARRRLPIGAEPQPGGLVSVRVWAPDHARVGLVLDGAETAMEPDGAGYFSAVVPGAAGSLYGFRLDGRPSLLADPASRSQPDGPHGLSEVIDPGAFMWTDEDWAGLQPHGQILYELHVGTFTPQGTWRAAAEHLGCLQALGVTVVQMMPVADFPGRFGWGYDGVCWFAPTRLYGRPDDLRAFVDEAHRLGLGVILDVVYNHFGPDGCVLPAFAKQSVSERYKNEWGDALNYDGPGSEGMRALVLANVEYWIREFHVDGFRLDATQQIFDSSPEHLLAAISRRAREAAGGRGVLLVGENEPQRSTLMRPVADGGHGLDLLCNDDLHHTARVLLTGIREAYYSDYRGTPQELLSALRWGFLFQGQHYGWQQQARGEPSLDLPPWKFVAFLENHDQVANSASGARLSTLAAPGQLRAMTALLLLSPATPMLFQGQELGSERPFRYFADHAASLSESVRSGRREFLGQFVRYRQPEVADRVAPASPGTFTDCILDRAVTDRSRQWFALHCDLLWRRRTDPVLGLQPALRPEGAVLTERAFLLRWLVPHGDDRLLLVNLGHDLEVAALAEPLLAPPAGCTWELAWSSESVEYGGSGTPPFDPARWILPGHAAVFLSAVPRPDGGEGAPQDA